MRKRPLVLLAGLEEVAVWKKIVVVSAASLALGLVATVPWYWHDYQEYRYKIRRAQHIGGDEYELAWAMTMNRAEVRSLLGPPGDFTTRRDHVTYRPNRENLLRPAWPGDATDHWSTDSGRIMLCRKPRKNLIGA